MNISTTTSRRTLAYDVASIDVACDFTRKIAAYMDSFWKDYAFNETVKGIICNFLPMSAAGVYVEVRYRDCSDRDCSIEFVVEGRKPPSEPKGKGFNGSVIIPQLKSPDDVYNYIGRVGEELGLSAKARKESDHYAQTI